MNMKLSGQRRFLYGAIGGALGAFVAWLVAEVILGRALEQAHGAYTYALSIAYGTITGAFIGIAIGIAEGLAHGALYRFAANVALGTWLGAIGGFVGMLIAESLYGVLTKIGLGVIARSIGWACFGAFIGSAQGIARQSLKGTVNSLIGGAFGGLIGGLSFEAVSLTIFGAATTSALPRGVGLIIIGMLIGIFSALFERLLAYATLKIISGRMEGKEFTLDKPRLTIGRDERCDIPIYYDKDVAPKHALLEWNGSAYKIEAIGNATVMHLGKPIRVAQLSHNDIIIVGNTKLIYRTGSAITAPISLNACPNCGATNRYGAKFCNMCGKMLPSPRTMLMQRGLQLASSIAIALIALSILIGAVHFFSSHTFATRSSKRFYGTDAGAQLAVTPKGYDDIGQVLSELGEGYEFEQIGFDKLDDPTYLSRFQVVFINCSRRCTDSEAIRTAASIRQYVEKGGVIYASDWAATIIQKAFPEYVRFADEKGDVQTVNATVTDEALASIVGRNLSLRFNATNWFAIESVASNVTVHMIGDYSDMNGRVHSGKPLLISFRHGNGFVVFTCFHNEPQLSEAEKKLLQFLVVRPVTFELSKKADSLLVAKRSSAVREFIGTISTGKISPPYMVTLKAETALLIVLTWRGGNGEFEIQVQTEDGKSLHSKRGENSPLTLETAKLPPATYTVRIIASKTPLENTPYALHIGTR
ncbi:MAG: FHA domain-containing protein [Armatimonadota bacterium]|nr:FHA domain-containing protein [Armatimonadota bacterium]MCX7777990.1 FHA domain-containing protein [Armatimonadota bacterium]MDW8026155.1 FHA domain-containing protein [Armatimonadota bacterium]